MKLRRQEDLDRLMTDHIETTHFVEEDGTPYEPEEPPKVSGWGDDGDDDDDDDDEA